MNVLLTGGTGFVGIAIAEKLLQEGLNIVLYDLNPFPDEVAKSFQAFPGKSVYVHGNVLDQPLLEQTIAANRVSTIIHAAAITPDSHREIHDGRSIVEVNSAGTATVLNAARISAIEKFIYVSTGAVYGKGQWEEPMLYEDKSPTSPSTFYEITKFASERIALRYKELTGLNLLIVRLGDVFGAWEYASGARDVLSSPFQATRLALLGEKAWLPRPGTKNWVYSRDIAASIFALLNSDKLQHDVYHLSAEYRWSIEQWCALLAEKYTDFSYEISDDDDHINLIFRPDHAPMNIDRLIQDTQYRPHFDLNKSFDDYTQWIERYPVFLKF